MQDVFKLRAADIYRVLHVERIRERGDRNESDATVASRVHRWRPALAGLPS